MAIKECPLEIKRRHDERTLRVRERLKGSAVVKRGFTEGTALREARRCLGNSRCEYCDLCRLLCPDLAITRNGNKGQIEIDYDYCKGCSICASVCPKGAIKMVLENTFN